VFLRGRILGQNLDKSLKSFPPCYSQVTSTYISIYSNSRNLYKFLHFSYCIETIPPSHGLKDPYRNLKSENSQDYAQKPQKNCTFMNSASCHFDVTDTYSHYRYAGANCLTNRQTLYEAARKNLTPSLCHLCARCFGWRKKADFTKNLCAFPYSTKTFKMTSLSVRSIWMYRTLNPKKLIWLDIILLYKCIWYLFED